MFRNRNGYWMSPKFFALFAPDDGGNGAAGDGAPGGDDGAGNGAGGAGDGGNGDDTGESTPDALKAEIARLNAEMAKQKAAIDRATKEAAENKRALKEKEQALKAKMTQEEIDAANKKEADEKAAKELEELRKEVARAKSTKSVMSKLSVDEDTAGKIAECLFGCEDVDNALLLIQKAWEAREKALRLEFGKIPGPGAGGDSKEDAEEKAAIELAKALGRDKASSDKTVTDALKGYMR